MIDPKVTFKATKKRLFAKKPILASQRTNPTLVLDEAEKQERTKTNIILRNQWREEELKRIAMKNHKVKYFKVLLEIQWYRQKGLVRPSDTFKAFLTNLEIRFKVILHSFLITSVRS